MKKEFKFEDKDTYTKEEISGILQGHTSFVKQNLDETHIPIEEYNKTKDVLKKYTSLERAKKIDELATETFGIKKLDAFKELKAFDKFSELEEEDKRKEFILKLKKEKPSLFGISETPSEIVKKQPKTEEKKVVKQYRFSNLNK